MEVLMGLPLKRTRLAAVLIAAVLAGCHGHPENEVQGYVEGDFVRISLPQSGIVETVTVKRGDAAPHGRVLFTLDSARETAALEKARAELAVAQAELSNLTATERDAEIEAMASEVNELKATLAYTMAAHQRHFKLSRTGATPVDDADRLKSEELAIKAKIQAAESRLQLARQSIGRDDEIQAARKTVSAREAAVREAEANLALRQAVSPADAVVNDVIYRPGETVAAGQAVVELLPPENIKARFYLSAKQVGWAKTDPQITLKCETCGDGIPARVSFVSPEAAYRPPILYSRNQSEKLAFLVEASPQSAAPQLRPGQPVTVVFPE